MSKTSKDSTSCGVNNMQLTKCFREKTSPSVWCPLVSAQSYEIQYTSKASNNTQNGYCIHLTQQLTNKQKDPWHMTKQTDQQQNLDWLYNTKPKPVDVQTYDLLHCIAGTRIFKNINKGKGLDINRMLSFPILGSLSDMLGVACSWTALPLQPLSVFHLKKVRVIWVST